MGLNIARTFYRPDWACPPQDPSGKCDWNSVRMQALYSWLTEMQKRGVTVALQAGYYFPADTYNPCAPTGTPGCKVELQPGPSDLATYAAWVSESIHQIIQIRGFQNVKYLVMFTEPNGQSGSLPPGTTLYSYYSSSIRAIHNQLIQDGRRTLVQFVGPNYCCVTDGSEFTMAVQDLKDVLDVYSGHNYNKADYAGWYKLYTDMKKAVAPTGKPFWADEFGYQSEALRATDEYANYLAQGVAASMNAGIQTTLLWLLFDQQYINTGTNYSNTATSSDGFYNGIQRDGTCTYPGDTLPNAGQPRASWYGFSMMSRYLGGGQGTFVLQTTSDGAGVYLAAAVSGTADYGLLLVNGSTTERPVNVQFNRPLGRTLYQYSYTPGEIRIDPTAMLIPFGTSYPTVGNTLTLVLSPMSVTVLSTTAGTAGTVPVAPTGLTAVAGSQSVSLTWKANSSNEDGFRIERAEGIGPFVVMARTAAGTTSFVDQSVASASTYVYRLCAYRMEGCSSFTDPTAAVKVSASSPGLLGWWPLAGDLTERTGQHPAPKASNVVFSPDGRSGTSALHVSGSNSFVDLDTFTFGNQFSFSVWVKPDQSSNTANILTNRPPGCNSNGFALFVNTFGTSDGSLHLETGNGSSCLAMSSNGAGTILPVGSWSHIVVTAARANQRAVIYLNGTVVTTGTTLGDYLTSGTLRLGGPLNATAFSFIGGIQDLRVYGYVLSQAEVQALLYAGIPQPPVITSVSSAAGTQSAIEAGSWASIYGSSLADQTDDWNRSIVNGQLPTSLDTVKVAIDGKPAYVYFISAGQINVQVPASSTQGPVSVVVTNNGVSSAPATAQMLSFAPAFFQLTPTKYAIATRFPDYAIIADPNAVPGAVGAKPGDVVILWGTGFGATNPSESPGTIVTGAPAVATIPAISVGGAPATLISAVLSPGSVGLYQVAIRLPASLPSGDVPIMASLPGSSSPAGVFIFVAP
jgi:uncharacterized protein (TIGR03437 family)